MDNDIISIEELFGLMHKSVSIISTRALKANCERSGVFHRTEQANTSFDTPLPFSATCTYIFNTSRGNHGAMTIFELNTITTEVEIQIFYPLFSSKKDFINDFEAVTDLFITNQYIQYPSHKGVNKYLHFQNDRNLGYLSRISGLTGRVLTLRFGNKSIWDSYFGSQVIQSGYFK